MLAPRATHAQIRERPDGERRLLRIERGPTMRRTRAINCGTEALERRLLLADPMVSINVKKPTASETNPTAAGLGQFTVRRTGEVARALDVNVRFSPGASTATSGQDIEPVVRTVRIRAGRAYAHFNVTPIDDAVGDPSETVVVKVFNGQYDVNPARPKVRLRIADNEPVVGIVATDRDASEDGADPAQFRIARSGSTARPLTVGYYVRNTSSATSGADFEALPGSVTIPAGQASTTFSVVPIDDDVAEPGETVIVTLRFVPTQYRGPHSATVTIADNDTSRAGWWNDNWEFRVPVTVEAGPHDRTDKPVERRINFTELFNQLDVNPALIDRSIRVIETTADGSGVVDENVPFQFDKDADYNPALNATGTLTFLMKGDTESGAARHYHVYFDNNGSFDVPGVAPLITTTDNVTDEGQATVRIATLAGTYFYQKAAGGFSSLVDAAGNDWIDFHPDAGSGSAGEFRGIPNMGPAFHPGHSDVITEIVSQGPLKVTLESRTTDNQRRVRWEFFPTYARMTVVEFTGSYWFLYEGTPGGAMDDADTVVRSDGTVTNRFTAWNDADGLGSGNGQEWAYFRDSAVNRFLFMAHHETDNVEDSYFNLDDNMTVFGFGRRNTAGGSPARLLSGVGNTFTIGLSSSGGSSDAAETINGAYQNLNLNQAAAETRT
jgi:hypothetical protein